MLFVWDLKCRFIFSKTMNEPNIAMISSTFLYIITQRYTQFENLRATHQNERAAVCQRKLGIIVVAFSNCRACTWPSGYMYINLKYELWPTWNDKCKSNCVYIYYFVRQHEMAEVQETTINNLNIRHFMIDHIDHGFEENFEINFGTPNMLLFRGHKSLVFEGSNIPGDWFPSQTCKLGSQSISVSISVIPPILRI